MEARRPPGPLKHMTPDTMRLGDKASYCYACSHGFWGGGGGGICKGPEHSLTKPDGLHLRADKVSISLICAELFNHFPVYITSVSTSKITWIGGEFIKGRILHCYTHRLRTNSVLLFFLSLYLCCKTSPVGYYLHTDKQSIHIPGCICLFFFLHTVAFLTQKH